MRYFGRIDPLLPLGDQQVDFRVGSMVRLDRNSLKREAVLSFCGRELLLLVFARFTRRHGVFKLVDPDWSPRLFPGVFAP